MFSVDTPAELNSPRVHPPEQAPALGCAWLSPCFWLRAVVVAGWSLRMWSGSKDALSAVTALGLDGTRDRKGELLRTGMLWWVCMVWYGTVWKLQYEKQKLE